MFACVCVRVCLCVCVCACACMRVRACLHVFMDAYVTALLSVYRSNFTGVADTQNIPVSYMTYGVVVISFNFWSLLCFCDPHPGSLTGCFHGSVTRS